MHNGRVGLAGICCALSTAVTRDERGRPGMKFQSEG